MAIGCSDLSAEIFVLNMIFDIRMAECWYCSKALASGHFVHQGIESVIPDEDSHIS